MPKKKMYKKGNKGVQMSEMSRKYFNGLASLSAVGGMKDYTATPDMMKEPKKMKKGTKGFKMKKC